MGKEDTQSLSVWASQERISYITVYILADVAALRTEAGLRHCFSGAGAEALRSQSARG